MNSTVEDALKRVFNPEFLNRIDETIIFRPLTQEQIVRVVGLMIKDVQGRLAERGITFELTADANLWLGREGYDPVYGARPLRRAVTRFLENPMSKGILSGEFLSGDHVLVDAAVEGLTLTKVAAPKAEASESETPEVVTSAS